MTPLCHIIGILDDGLASLRPAVIQQLQQAQWVIGPQRLLALVETMVPVQATRQAMDGLTSHIPAWIETAWATKAEVVVLASGDPMFHGLGSYLAKRLPLDSWRVEPNLSYLQIALARLGIGSEEVARVSVHRGDSGPWQPGAGPSHALYPLIRVLAEAERIALLTSPANNPARIASLLVAEGLADAFHVTVAEHLCRTDEKISRDLTPDQVSQAIWADPNVVILHRIAPRPVFPVIGLPEAVYHDADGGGLVTRREVRAAALGQLALIGNETVWDLGAGSGSIALEAARLCPKGWVWAVDKSADAIRRIEANRRHLGLFNLTLLQAKAPNGLGAWPDPDAVFIGGSCGQMDGMIRQAWSRLRPGGRLVINLVTLENILAAMASLNALTVSWEAVQIHAARSKPIFGANHRLEGTAPVWILTATRQQGEKE